MRWILKDPTRLAAYVRAIVRGAHGAVRTVDWVYDMDDALRWRSLEAARSDARALNAFVGDEEVRVFRLTARDRTRLAVSAGRLGHLTSPRRAPLDRWAYQPAFHVVDGNVLSCASARITVPVHTNDGMADFRANAEVAWQDAIEQHYKRVTP